MRPPRISLVALLVGCFLLPAAIDAAESQRQSLQEKRAVRKVLGQYRRARRDLDAKAAAVAQAGSIGPAAVEEVLVLVEQDLDPLLTKYRQEFLKASRAAAAEKYQGANMAQVEELRARVLALREDPELKKETIVQVADPAMKQLQDLLILEPAQILAANPRLLEQREGMMGIGLLWQNCHAYLAKFGAPRRQEKEEKQEGAEPGNEEAQIPDQTDAITFAEFLEQEEGQVLRMALPMNDSTREVLEYNSKLASKLAPEEYRCVIALNMTRILLGIEPVKVDLQLTEASRDHSKDMKTLDFFSHTSPVEGKRSFTDRAKLKGTSASGENIAYGKRKGYDTNLQWFHSPGHHRNMLSGHKRVGIGKYESHWTQMFGR